MAKIKRMDQIRRILQTYQQTGSIKGTAARLKISKNTVREYKRRAEMYHADLNIVLALDDDKLRPLMYPDAQGVRANKRLFFDGKVDDYLRRLRQRHTTRQILYEEYARDCTEGYKPSQFYLLLRQAAQRRDLTLPLKHPPGKAMQVDYAGDRLSWVDIRTGEVHRMQVLVATLPHSAHTFAIALPSQSTVDFVYGLGRALRFFGGVPQTIVSDNLKAFVKKTDRYEPDFNDTCVQLANHYEVDLQATRVRKPKDKASVEGAVRVVYQRVYTQLAGRIFHSPEALNAAIAEQLEVLVDRPFQKRPGSRREAFATEREYLRPLPTTAFALKTTTRATVQRNYHVEVGPGHNFYSVPFQYVGRRATVVYSRSTVEVFIGPDRVATHSRRRHPDKYAYTTDAAHLPRNHAEYLAAEGHNGAYFRSWGDGIGPATGWAMAKILTNKTFEVQTYRSCQGVQSLARHYGNSRLEAAAKRCQTAGQARYGMLKNILERGLDRTSDQLDLFAPPTHDNIRGAEAYQ